MEAFEKSAEFNAAGLVKLPSVENISRERITELLQAKNTDSPEYEALKQNPEILEKEGFVVYEHLKPVDALKYALNRAEKGKTGKNAAQASLNESGEGSPFSEESTGDNKNLELFIRKMQNIPELSDNEFYRLLNSQAGNLEVLVRLLQ